MSRPKKRKPRFESCSYGSYGHTVRVIERVPNGFLYLVWRDDAGRQCKRSLKHKNLRLAQDAARAGSEGRGRRDGTVNVPITVRALIDNYLANGLKRVGDTYAADKRRQMARWLEYFPDSRQVRSLSPSDVHGFMTWRMENSRRRLKATTLWHDWKALDIALNFATKQRDAAGVPLLASHPLAGLIKLPKTASPARPVATRAYFEALVAVADQLPWQFRVALILARESGHRIGAILKLCWNDVDWTRSATSPMGSLRWRAENDKVQNEHVVPMTPAAQGALVGAQKFASVDGEGLVFPSPTSPRVPLDRHLASRWLHKAERLAGWRHQTGSGWHALRRGWASQRLNIPDVAVAAAGGWKDTETMKKAYQHADHTAVLSAVYAGVE